MRKDVFKNRRALVIGMARSGIDAALLLHAQGAFVSIYDNKMKEDVQGISKLDSITYTSYLGNQAPNLEQIDLVIVSPGVPLDIPLILAIKERDIELIGEVELAYRCAQGRFVGITGTNGKTTTTALLGQMFILGGFNAYIVGNIGIPISSAVLESDSEDAIYVSELSSYQLETIVDFSVMSGALLNITPDHLARHKTMAAYTDAKLNLFKNMQQQNIILNMDHDRTLEIGNSYPSARYFSKLSSESFVGLANVMGKKCIVVRNDIDKKKVDSIIPISEIKLIGEHNVENALAAVAVAHICGVSHTAIAEALKSFAGYPHRIEYVATIDGVTYYNDSKATNPEASIPAIKAMTAPTVLIGGGMDKGSDYKEWIEQFKTIKHVVLFGETKFAIAEAIQANSNVPYTIVNTLQEATALAKQLAVTGDFVLLSPACASWDMFESFEERGDLFKRLVLLS